MNRNRRPLINSPRGQQAQQENYEFTPIGGTTTRHKPAQTSNASTSRIPITGPTRLNFNKNPSLDQSPLDHRNHNGSSFIDDSEYDILDQADDVPLLQVFPRELVGQRDNNLLQEASNPVLQQQEQMSSLQTQNYNLKVELAGLNKFLNSVTSKDQQELYEENSRLQRESLQLNSELKLLKQELAQEKGRDTNTRADRVRNLENETLKSKVRSLMEQVENLKHSKDENEVLRRSIRELSEENEELKMRLTEVQDSQSMQDQAKIKNFQENIESLHGEIEDLQYESRRKDTLLEERDHELEELEIKLKEYKQRSTQRDHATEGQVDELKALLNRTDDENHGLKQLLREHEEKLQTSKSQLNNANDKLRESLKNEDRFINALESANKKISLLEEQSRATSGTRHESDHIISELKNHQIDLESEIKRLQNELKQTTSLVKEQEQVITNIGDTDSFVETLRTENISMKSSIQSLKREIKTLSDERDSLRTQVQYDEEDYQQLKAEHDKVYRAYQELKRNELHPNRDLELDNELETWKAEVDRLSSQLQGLNVQNQQLQRDLEKERYTTIHESRRGDEEFNALLDKYQDLQNDRVETDNYITKLKSRFEDELNRYLLLVQDKESEIIRLRDELRTTEVTKSHKIDDEKFELLRLKASKENQIKSLQIELENLQWQHESEVKRLRGIIDRLEQNLPNGSAGGGDYDNLGRRYKRDTDDLTSKIQEKNRKIRELTDSLSDAESTVKDLERRVIRLDDDKTQLNTENRTLQRKVDSLDDKLSELTIKKESTDDAKEYIIELKDKLREKIEQLQHLKEEKRKVDEDLKKIGKDVFEKDLDSRDEKIKLVLENDKLVEEKELAQRRLENAKSEYSSLTDTYNSLLDKYHSLKSKQPQQTQLSLLQYKLEVTSRQLLKSQYIVQDLKFMNEFMKDSIQTTRNELRENIRELQKVGIYPNYDEINKKKLKFTVLARFVIAAIRIKRKTEYNKIREYRAKDLNKKIEEIEG